MSPAPKSTVIKTVSRPSVQYALLALCGALLAFGLAAFLSPAVGHVVAEVGRLLVGMPNR